MRKLALCLTSCLLLPVLPTAADDAGTIDATTSQLRAMIAMGCDDLGTLAAQALGQPPLQDIATPDYATRYLDLRIYDLDLAPALCLSQ